MGSEIIPSIVSLAIVLAGIVGFAELTAHVHIIAGLVWGFTSIGLLGALKSHWGDPDE